MSTVGEKRHRVPGRAVLPSGRALVGALLMSSAAIGTFVAWSRSSQQSDDAYVVAARSVQPGERLSADDVRSVAVDLDGSPVPAFASEEAVVGRVALGPIGEGELVQPAQVTEVADDSLSTEVSFMLPRDRAVDGRLRSGDSVDIIVTEGDVTRVAVDEVRVVSSAEESGLGGAPGAGIVVTVGLADPDRRLDLIHALHLGDVTLTRSLGSS